MVEPGNMKCRTLIYLAILHHISVSIWVMDKFYDSGATYKFMLRIAWKVFDIRSSSLVYFFWFYVGLTPYDTIMHFYSAAT